MQYRSIGDSDLRVSEIGLGCNGFGSRVPNERVVGIAKCALDNGVNFFDIADIYGNDGGAEILLGQAINTCRASVIVGTKFGRAKHVDPSRITPAHIESSLNASLGRLNTDYIDLYQYHGPMISLPSDETILCLGEFVQEGKVRYIGCCNVPHPVFIQYNQRAFELGAPQLVSCQVECNLLKPAAIAHRGPDCQDKKIALLPFLPLAGGVLSGSLNISQGVRPDSRLALSPLLTRTYLSMNSMGKVAKLSAFASDNGRSLLELAIGWLLSEPTIPSIIAGASSSVHIIENLASSTWRLTNDEKSRIATLVT